MAERICGTCDQPIEAGANFVDVDPPRHVHCWTPGTETARPVLDPVVQMLKQRGYHSTSGPHEPSTVHAERPASHAYWDLPGHLPYVVVSQTACPGPDPELATWVQGHRFLCRHKHTHRRIESEDR